MNNERTSNVLKSLCCFLKRVIDPELLKEAVIYCELTPEEVEELGLTDDILGISKDEMVDIINELPLEHLINVAKCVQCEYDLWEA